jgi:Immunoglobulin I-set domain
VDVVITPTTLPVSTNTQTVILGLANPSAYQFGTPSKGTIYIQNTGPQLLVLTVAGGGASMYRGVTNDYAKFVITRFGDTNGPGNSAGNVSQIPYTVTNLSYYGTAKYPDDYRARAQRADPAADGKIQTPVDGPTAIVIYPGNTTVTCIVGNPVMHTNFNYTPTNLTIIFNLTNAVTCGVGGACTNGIPTPEGFTYNVLAATVTLTEVDNAVGPEVVLWSDTMTNAANSVNYTLTYAGTNFGVGGMPVVIPNYINNQTSIYGTGIDATNDFLVNFGSDIATNSVPVPPSPVMLASNWPQKALKMTVNKASSTICGVNVYPAAQFGGNYALRFNMFLSLWSQYINDPYISQNFREYALFGVNHYGTNCIWRPSTTMIAGTGMIPTNSDGQWFAIDAGSGGTTPADYEVYIPGPVPNNANANGSGLRGINSWSGTSPVPQGYLKHPPFDTMNTTEATRTVAAPGGGAPVDKWVDVSVEITAQTNLTLWINRSTWLASAAITNGLGWGYAYTNGTIMLGYDDPDRTVSDPLGQQSAFVYYSNVRVVELSPYIVLQPTLMGTNVYSLIRTQGASLVLTAAVNYASAPITSVWFRASVATVGSAAGETLSNPYVQSNWFNATSANLSLALNNVQAVSGTNFVLQVRDPAGSVNSAPVALEVVSGPTNAVASINSTFLFVVRAAGPAVVAPTAYQWQTNGVNLVTSGHYPAASNLGTNVTRTNLNIFNVQPADAGTYSLLVTSPAGTVTPTATLTVVSAIAPAGQTNLWGSTASFTVTATGPTPTYQWKKNLVNVTAAPNITGANSSVLTISPVLATNAGIYTVGVTNGLGVLVAQAILTISVPPPVFTPGGASLVGGNMVMSFSSPNNPNDTASSFVLQSCGYVLAAPAVTPFTNNLTAVFSTPSPGQFQVSVPQTGDTMFYRLVHVYP